MTINSYGVDCTGWQMVHPRATPDMLGYVPGFLVDSDPRPAREQFNERYRFGGWKPNRGFIKSQKSDALIPRRSGLASGR